MFDTSDPFVRQCWDRYLRDARASRGHVIQPDSSSPEIDENAKTVSFHNVNGVIARYRWTKARRGVADYSTSTDSRSHAPRGWTASGVFSRAYETGLFQRPRIPEPTTGTVAGRRCLSRLDDFKQPRRQRRVVVLNPVAAVRGSVGPAPSIITTKGPVSPTERDRPWERNKPTPTRINCMAALSAVLRHHGGVRRGTGTAARSLPGVPGSAR